MAEWTLLPKDLLQQISKFLDTSIDLLRFRSVCTSWRSSVSPESCRSSDFSRILPNGGISCTSVGFSLYRRSIFLIGLPDPHNQTNPDGWLVKFEEDVPTGKHFLLNPLSRHRLNSLPRNFPRILDFLNFRVSELGHEFVLHHVNCKTHSRSIADAGNLYMEKVAMLRLNCETDFLLLTIHVSGKLAIFKSGNERWTIIQDRHSLYDDVIAYNGKLYAVDGSGGTVVVALNAELSLIANPVYGGDKKYLVESRCELLLVDMYLSFDTEEGSLTVGDESEHLADNINERTFRFKVFKLDEELQSWVKVNSLDDRVLFLGDDSTFSASAADLPGCEGNSIFFVDNFFYSRDNNPNGGDDGVLAGQGIRVFDMETGRIGPLENYPEYAKIFWPPPRWLASTSLEVQTQNQLEELSL